MELFIRVWQKFPFPCPTSIWLCPAFAPFSLSEIKLYITPEPTQQLWEFSQLSRNKGFCACIKRNKREKKKERPVTPDLTEDKRHKSFSFLSDIMPDQYFPPPEKVRIVLLLSSIFFPSIACSCAKRKLTQSEKVVLLNLPVWRHRQCWPQGSVIELTCDE